MTLENGSRCRRIGWVGALVVVLVAASGAWAAEVVWQDDWTDGEGWKIYEGPQIKAWWAIEDGAGVFGVSNANTWAHFLPAARGAVDVERLKDYYFVAEIRSVSKSVSYQLDLDAFDGSGKYLRTITVYPQGTDVRKHEFALKSVPKANWKGVAQVAPKLGLSSGKSRQEIRVGEFRIEDRGGAE